MEEEQVLNLYDFYWFQHKIFTKLPNSSHSIDPIPKPSLSRLPSRHFRSLSDELSSQTCSNPDHLSPNSVLQSPKLKTILSGKEVEEDPRQNPIRNLKKSSKKAVNRRKLKKYSKSLSDLEFEELKGFSDLGFTFSAEEMDSRLFSVVPGLNRLIKKEGVDVVHRDGVSRPYLSEAWDVDQTVKKPLMYWRLPDASDEVDMKDNIREWAHVVASTLR